MSAASEKTTTGTKTRNSSSRTKNDDLAAEIEALRADVGAVTERLSKIATVGAKTARTHGDDAALTVRQKSDALIDDLTTQLDDIERRAGKAVRSNPLQTLALAAGAGFLAAILLRR